MVFSKLSNAFERATFNQACQLSDETAEHFIMRLHRLAETCEFGELKSDMIRDRLVIGIRDGQLSERLQLESDLTLQKAEKLVQQQQAVQEQQVTLKQHCSNYTESRDTPPSRHTSEEAFTGTETPSTQSSWQKCRRCGRGSHPRQDCPARDATCHRCNHKGHYSAQCLSKTILELTSSSNPDQESDTYSDVIYLNNVNEQAVVTPRKLLGMLKSPS